MTSLAIRYTRPTTLLAVAIIVAVVSQVASLILGTQRPPSGAPPADPRVAALAVPDALVGTPNIALGEIDAAIGRWTANLKRDPVDYISATNLGSLYSSRGRLTGNLDDYVRASEAAEQGMAAASSYKPAAVLEATLQYATHDFVAAVTSARAIYAADPTQLQALATIGDGELELGDYAAAATSYDTLERAVPGPAVTARLARLAALQGDLETAIANADLSVNEADVAGVTGAGLAWYRFLAGFVAFQAGNIGAAETRFAAALSDQPGSFLVLNGLARVRAAQGRYADAIALDQKAIAIVPQPEFLAELGDLYKLSGQPKLAEEQYATVRAIARLASIQKQVYNRQLVLFDVNHDEHLDEALTLARAELAVRKDVYGYDALAWALLANGRAGEADVAMRQALAQGTEDALLDYHAGMIASALGDQPRARDLLRRALALNAGWDPLQAQRARAALQAVGG
jgi:tetratricopeptide (TPR) repeat protein